MLIEFTPSKRDLKPMKVIDMTDKTAAKAYLSRPVEDTHTKEELEAVHRAINHTHMFHHEESMSKMDAEETIERPLPRIPKRK